MPATGELRQLFAGGPTSKVAAIHLRKIGRPVSFSAMSGGCSGAGTTPDGRGNTVTNWRATPREDLMKGRSITSCIGASNQAGRWMNRARDGSRDGTAAVMPGQEIPLTSKGPFRKVR
jgi:hypothetical protein